MDELQESGVISENLPAEAGSRFSLTESLVRAGRTVLQNLKGMNIVSEYQKFHVLYPQHAGQISHMKYY